MRTVTGKVMPIDAAPNDKGNVAIKVEPSGALFGWVISEERPLLPSHVSAGYQLYMSHFATCPNWRE
jgi:hypothetical protein